MRRLSLIAIFVLLWSSAFGQSPHGPNLKIDCAQCHTSESWDVQLNRVSFDHSTTNFALEGTHQTTDCASCHQSLVFENQSSDCISCHKDIHEQSLGNDCMRCHTQENWLVMNIPELHESNGFSLTGNHSNLSCSECHTNANELRITPLGNDCVNCHEATFNATVNPNHQSAGFSKDCTQCHDASKIGWNLADIDHSFFPLTEGHEISDCTQCHDMSNLSNISADCVSCHQSNFDATSNPKHSAANFSTDCASCHTTAVGWKPTNFSHDFFPLSGGHSIDDCTTCHVSDNFTNLSSECVDCHLDNFNATSTPNHKASGYPTDCVTCHTTNPGWTPANLNHDFFPLTGVHDLQDCTQCHVNNDYSTLSSECVSCHQVDYDATTNPNHSAANYPTDCTQCHSTASGWTPATVNHDFFPLTGAHNISDCTTCHVNDNYTTLSSECVSCHQSDFDATTNPNHRAANYPTDCAQCHTTASGWTPATVNHDFFPLTQGHDIADCTTCHVDNNYTTLSSECVSCHQSNYDATTNPNHSAANYPTDCTQCHTTSPGWTPATVNHDFFPLTLGHNISDCSVCHVNNNYTTISSDCVDCHLTDFNTATDPNHKSAGFPQDCVSCHSTNPGWSPTTFNHDGQYFPIYSGEHRGEWSSCTDCHKDASNFASFSCFDCHRQSSMDSEHRGVSGYVYDSNACFTCHPNPD